MSHAAFIVTVGVRAEGSDKPAYRDGYHTAEAGLILAVLVRAGAKRDRDCARALQALARGRFLAGPTSREAMYQAASEGLHATRAADRQFALEALRRHGFQATPVSADTMEALAGREHELEEMEAAVMGDLDTINEQERTP